ncbi:short chain dehydrogenase [Legionella taurinensis]|uniref:Short chain dehydrogenase n=1 Tax=Legionella taurinensis TaxID=70611 RepID=A0A3A5L7S5_9GAMM|nr:short chain dehydrogenase [Legionella taurinensis]MDX1836723.1 short chain dehydrogenase [Legionella taurinensis]PUT43141.1 short chain dehydrogenase [Legionella taurinensis]PUT45696.1 short chain dehydrogenase [Legionella taurinensis]PUT47071.1 short chain dehydrogenase [Legionella taurinensis]PUT49465.1 short chain dehydrogenase [Legionella taurinensis]
MKIVIIGASGTIGTAIVQTLETRHEVIKANYSGGDIQVDITDNQSIANLFKQIKHIDAVVLATGKVQFDDFMAMDDAAYQIGLQNKLMGQVNVVLEGRKHLNEGGSFTLTSGILSCDPIRYGTSASMVNGAIDSFVIAAAIEMPRGLRINAVSPTVIEEAMDNYASYFRGYAPVTAARAALAYSKSVEGLQTGQVYRVE